ncbi:MAG: hypothetical protein ABFS18_09460 [Thermodesulfobacteriota bacterium]
MNLPQAPRCCNGAKDNHLNFLGCNNPLKINEFRNYLAKHIQLQSDDGNQSSGENSKKANPFWLLTPDL